MSEHQPSPTDLDTHMLGDRSLREWHTYLTTDKKTGTYTGHLDTPGSRYGRTSDQAAYWAIALQLVYTHANGQDDSMEDGIEACMGYVVNDYADVVDLVRSYEWVIPDGLRDELDLESVDWDGGLSR